MKKPVITRDKITTVSDKRFVRLYAMEYMPGKFYYNASRREADALVALKNPEEARTMLADAVSCVVVLCAEGQEPRLLLSWEYRYPAGRSLLSVPAGLIDPEDRSKPDALAITAIRELKEETGLVFGEGDRLQIVNPFLYSTPGLTDESNALVCMVLHLTDFSGLNQSGAEGTEFFEGFSLPTLSEARELIRAGRDEHGNFYSIHTLAALMYFTSQAWVEPD